MSSLEDKRNFVYMLRGSQFKREEIQAVYSMISEDNDDSRIKPPSEIIIGQNHK